MKKSKSKIDQIESTYPEEKITELYLSGRNRIDSFLTNFINEHASDKERLIARWEDIRQLIYHVNDRINYWEGRRTQFLTFAAGILVATLAAQVTVANNIIDKGYSLTIFILFLPVLFPSIVLFIGSIRIIIIWNRQNNPSYPFTKGYRNWRWHYRHAELHPLDTRTSKYTIEEFNQQVEFFVDNLFSFKKKMLEAELKDFFDQDLSQLYLCITNEKYKIKFVSELRDALVISLSLALWIFICALITSTTYFICTSGVFNNIVPTVIIGILGVK